MNKNLNQLNIVARRKEAASTIADLETEEISIDVGRIFPFFESRAIAKAIDAKRSAEDALTSGALFLGHVAYGSTEMGAKYTIDLRGVNNGKDF